MKVFIVEPKRASKHQFEMILVVAKDEESALQMAQESYESSQFPLSAFEVNTDKEHVDYGRFSR